jgi:hypothetical protein
MGIKLRADGGFRKFSALNELGFRRTVKRFEMPYVSYPRPLCVKSHINFTFAMTYAYNRRCHHEYN